MTEIARTSLAVLLVLAATACGPSSSVPSDAQAVARNVAMPAQAVIGTVEVTASVVPSLQLGAAAARYGVEPAVDRVLVLVAARDGDADVPVQVTGHARDLRGVRQTLQFEAVDTGSGIEHVALTRVSGPDTMRLELDITAGDGARTSLRFNRDIPR
ncbi:MAG: DUF4426 domain-containing protein [Luteimonas sp.]